MKYNQTAFDNAIKVSYQATKQQAAVANTNLNMLKEAAGDATITLTPLSPPTSTANTELKVTLACNSVPQTKILNFWTEPYETYSELTAAPKAIIDALHAIAPSIATCPGSGTQPSSKLLGALANLDNCVGGSASDPVCQLYKSISDDYQGDPDNPGTSGALRGATLGISSTTTPNNYDLKISFNRPMTGAEDASTTLPVSLSQAPANTNDARQAVAYKALVDGLVAIDPTTSLEDNTNTGGTTYYESKFYGAAVNLNRVTGSSRVIDELFVSSDPVATTANTISISRAGALQESVAPLINPVPTFVVTPKDLVCPNLMSMTAKAFDVAITGTDTAYHANMNTYGMHSYSKYSWNGVASVASTTAPAPAGYILTDVATPAPPSTDPAKLKITTSVTTSSGVLPYTQDIQSKELDSMIQIVGALKKELSLANPFAEPAGDSTLAYIYSETMTTLARSALSDLQKIVLSANTEGTGYYLKPVGFVNAGGTGILVTAQNHLGLSVVSGPIGSVSIDPKLYSNKIADHTSPIAETPLTWAARLVLSMCTGYNNTPGSGGVGETKWINEYDGSNAFTSIRQDYSPVVNAQLKAFTLPDYLLGGAVCDPVTLTSTDSGTNSNPHTLTSADQKIFAFQIIKAFHAVNKLNHYADLLRGDGQLGKLSDNMDRIWKQIAPALDSSSTYFYDYMTDATWDFMEGIAHDVI